MNASATPGRGILLAVLGPTASGKSALAEQMALELNAQLINADAFQVYRGMDIGTAKPAATDNYELLDIRNPNEEFGVGDYIDLAADLLDRCHTEGRNVVLVGGTGYYVRALLEEFDELYDAPPAELRAEIVGRIAENGLDFVAQELREKAPQLAAATDLKNPVRVQRALERLHLAKRPVRKLPPFAQIKVGLEVEPDALESRINTRTALMVQNGWVEEVSNLRQRGFRPTDPGFRAIGYREMWRVGVGESSLEEAVATTIVETRKYAKRQRTWLRTEPRLERIDTRSEPLATVRRLVAALK